MVVVFQATVWTLALDERVPVTGGGNPTSVGLQ